MKSVLTNLLISSILGLCFIGDPLWASCATWANTPVNASEIISNPGKAWEALQARKKQDDPSGMKSQLDLPALHRRQAIEFGKESLKEYKEKLTQIHRDLDLSLLNDTLAELQHAEETGYIDRVTIEALNHYALVATKALKALERKTLYPFEKSLGDIRGDTEDFVGKMGIENYLSDPDDELIVYVTEDPGLLGFVRASPYLMDYIGTTNKPEWADTQPTNPWPMKPYQLLLHDWQHFWDKRELQKRLFSKEQRLSMIPLLKQNVDRMLEDLEKLPDGSFKDSIIVLAFEITHETGYPPSFKYIDKTKEIFKQVIMTKIRGNFYGPKYSNATQISDAWDWLMVRWP